MLNKNKILKNIYLILFLIIMLLTNTACDQFIPSDSDPNDKQTAYYSDSEINEIIDYVLTRGENANLLYGADFDTIESSQTEEGYLMIDLEKQSNEKKYPGTLELLRQIKSVEDIGQYYYDTFTPEVAKKYYVHFTTKMHRWNIYQDIDGKIYINMYLSSQPLVMGDWKRETVTVIENTPDKLVVELEVQYFTGTIEKRPLTIIKSGDKWLMDESYIVFEGVYINDENPAYTDSKIEKIINDVLFRGEMASLLYAADFDTIESSQTKDGYRLIDQDKQYDEQWYPGTLELVRQIKSVEDIEQYYYDTFTPEVAKNYIDIQFESKDFNLYKDINGKLYVNIKVSAMPLVMADWKRAPYTVIENNPDKLVVELEVQFFNFWKIERRLLTIIKCGDKWLMDESFEAYAKR